MATTQPSYHLQDVTLDHAADPRHFLIPSQEEIDQLQIGKLVRLFLRSTLIRAMVAAQKECGWIYRSEGLGST